MSKLFLVGLVQNSSPKWLRQDILLTPQPPSSPSLQMFLIEGVLNTSAQVKSSHSRNSVCQLLYDMLTFDGWLGLTELVRVETDQEDDFHQSWEICPTTTHQVKSILNGDAGILHSPVLMKGCWGPDGQSVQLSIPEFHLVFISFWGFMQLTKSRGGLLLFIAQSTIPLPGLGETQSLAFGKTYQSLALASQALRSSI